MTLLAILAVLGASGWIVFTTFRRFERRAYPTAWRAASVVFGIAGLVLGFCLLSHEYHTSERVRVTGYPFPVGASELIDGRWLGGLVSRFLLFAFLADMAAGVGLCLLPLRIAQLIYERRFTDEHKGKVES